MAANNDRAGAIPHVMEHDQHQQAQTKFKKADHHAAAASADPWNADSDTEETEYVMHCSKSGDSIVVVHPCLRFANQTGKATRVAIQ